MPPPYMKYRVPGHGGGSYWSYPADMDGGGAGDSCATWARKGVALFFEYDTPRIVHIRSKKVGVISRLVQLAILAYIIGWVIVYQKGYQQFDDVESAVTTKLKGVAYTNFTDEELANVPAEWRHLYRRVWDVTDYVVPPTQSNAFFVSTNVIVTPNQTQGACAEDPAVIQAAGLQECDPENPEVVCPRGESLPLGHGVNTGRCIRVDSHFKGGLGGGTKFNHSCEVLAWCPVERDDKPLGQARALLPEAENFTVLIKNQIEFPMYDKRRTNILESSNKSYLSGCTYDEELDPFCPVFRLGKIVELAGEDFSKVAVNGCVIAIIIEWDCDLDYDFMTNCRPKYKFRRLDNPKSKIAPGWNFRHSQYYFNGNRTLYKSYGLLFELDVQGKAGKLSFIPLAVNLGAGLALLSIATIVCDVIVLYLMKDRVLYREKKYLQVRGSDAYNVFRNSDQEEYQNLDSEEPINFDQRRNTLE